MKKAVLFDMDGTLLDTLSDITRSVNFTLRKLGFPERGQDEVRRYVGNGLKNAMRLALPEGMDEKTLDLAFSMLLEHYTQNSSIDTKPYDGVEELLSALHALGIKTAIVSNKFDSAVRELNEQWFSAEFAIGETKERRRKPAPDMLLLALHALGVSAEEALYVGDMDVDFKTAKNSGCTPILVSWGFRPRSELAALGCQIADSPKALLELIKAID